MRITKDAPFGECRNCAYEFNSELISEYAIKHCPNCGTKLDFTDYDEPCCEDEGSCISRNVKE